MSADEIKKAVTSLSDEERAALRARWDEVEAAAWDREMEEDIKAGHSRKL
ncbi:MAG TPA: hypothetical protein VGB91_09060 [Rhizomicrobium sp.]